MLWFSWRMKESAMPHLAPRPWVPASCETYIQTLATDAGKPSSQVASRLDALIEKNREIHDQDCFNLNPATNVMNPRAEAALASGIGSPPSHGSPGDTYEMGLEASEEIEVSASDLASEIFPAEEGGSRGGSGAGGHLDG
ncbi:MAG: serine hydroxymethyltransferase, partial [Paracoccaceae bacterium]